jgi:hypothetical protein
MTDRDLLVAILGAVSGLAERLTGEKMLVRIETDQGAVYVNSPAVEWERQPSAAAPPSHGDQRGCC